ncbi:MAG: hypothetical protein ACREYF_00480 [Gammaproteobacteria bacterium]
MPAHHLAKAEKFSARSLRLSPNTALRIALVATIGIAYSWIAADGRLHWDEPAYLYAAAYLDLPEILEGEFQPTGIPRFSTSRLVHVLFAHGIFELFGVGKHAFNVLVGCYLSALMAALWLSHATVRALLPAQRLPLLGAVVMIQFSPIFMWLSFKTMPEIPALLFATLGSYAFLRALQGRSVLWLTAAALSMATIAWTKNTLAFLPASLMLSLLLTGYGFRASDVLRYSVAAGLLSLAVFVLMTFAFDVSLSDYFSSFSTVVSENSPAIAKIAFSALEAGALWIFVPLALLNHRRKAVAFFLIWLIVATAPLLLLVRDIEPRYLLSNFIPLLGLIALSLEALIERMRIRERRYTLRVKLGAGVFVGCLIVSSALAQRIIGHEVEIPRIAEAIDALDSRFGNRQFSLLTPWDYTDFHYLRVMYPQYPVFSVRELGKLEDEVWNKVKQKTFYGHRFVRTLDELKTLQRPLVYFGFMENLAVANLREMVAELPVDVLKRKLALSIEQKVEHIPFQDSWIWNDSRVMFVDLFFSGHYRAALVEIVG